MPMTRVSFENDYNVGCHPDLLKVLVETNEVQTTGYGLDPYSQEASVLIKRACEAPGADVHFFVGGTQANLTVIAGILKPWQGVISADTGHINTHEAGAVEATGHKVLSIPSDDGLLTADEIDCLCRAYAEDPTAEHMVQPGMIYLSQTTELGTIYTKPELTAIREVADRWSLSLYIDGARLASALTVPGSDLDLVSLAELTDVFSIGGTKCGALFGEGVVITQESLKKDFRSLIKQRGGLLAKGRLIGLQFAEFFREDLYLEIGRHMNTMAMTLAEEFRARHIEFYVPPVSNQLFVILNREEAARFKQRAVFEQIDSLDERRGVFRFVTSYATSRQQIEVLFT
ncbi:MAG TPA: beta-eliminating lyase-related protein [Clostridia bacterium]|nr:beta-eliminating lyase-related protein [Clostridia bacterium]